VRRADPQYRAGFNDAAKHLTAGAAAPPESTVPAPDGSPPAAGSSASQPIPVIPGCPDRSAQRQQERAALEREQSEVTQEWRRPPPGANPSNWVRSPGQVASLGARSRANAQAIEQLKNEEVQEEECVKKVLREKEAQQAAIRGAQVQQVQSQRSAREDRARVCARTLPQDMTAPDYGEKLSSCVSPLIAELCSEGWVGPRALDYASWVVVSALISTYGIPQQPYKPDLPEIQRNFDRNGDICAVALENGKPAGPNAAAPAAPNATSAPSSTAPTHAACKIMFQPVRIECSPTGPISGDAYCVPGSDDCVSNPGGPTSRDWILKHRNDPADLGSATNALMQYDGGKVFRCLNQRVVLAAQSDPSLSATALEYCQVPNSLAVGAINFMGHQSWSIGSAWVDQHCTPLVGGYRCEWGGTWARFSN
jgi:hypothetical protein